MGVDWGTQVSPRAEAVGKVFGIYGQPVADSREILKICSDNNIKYAVFSAQFEGETAGLENFSLVFDDRTVKIYKIY